MAARRNKRQTKRTASSGGTPGWVWLIAGLAIGAVLWMAVPKLLPDKGDGFLRVGPRANPDAEPHPVADADIDAPASVAQDERPASPQYDFYTLLPGSEVQMSDAELAATAKAEAARESRNDRDAERAQAALTGQSLPAPLDETPRTVPPAAAPVIESQRALAALEGRSAASAPAVALPSANKPSLEASSTPASTTSTVPPPVPVAAAPQPVTTRYLLQAGAFGSSDEAESTKARLAMAGVTARVEPAQINGRTVYRVRMGPYPSAGELSEAKSKLESAGLQAMAIKSQ